MGEVGQSEGGRVKGILDEESIDKVTEDDKQPGASGNIQQIKIAGAKNTRANSGGPWMKC